MILILLSEKWIDCVILLQILCFAYLWNCITTINLNLLNVKGRSDLVLRLEIIKKSIAFTILFISIYFDLTAICLGSAIYSLIAFYSNTYYTKRILNYGFKKQFMEIFPYLMTSLLIMIEGLIISYYTTNPIISLCCALIICPLTYVGICIVLKFEAAMELLRIIKIKR